MSAELRSQLEEAEERLARARAHIARDEPLLERTRLRVAALQAGLTAAKIKLPEQGRTDFLEVAGAAFGVAMFSPILLIGVGVLAGVVAVAGSCFEDESEHPGLTAEGVVVRSDVPELRVASECTLVLEAARGGRCVATVRCGPRRAPIRELEVACRDEERESTDSEGATSTYDVAVVDDPSLSFDSETERAELRMDGATATLWFHSVEGSLEP